MEPKDFMKEYCDVWSIKVLEYMGKTTWHPYVSGDNYKVFRCHVELNLNHCKRQSVYYYMCRKKSGEIVYIGHTGNNESSGQGCKTGIVELERPKSTYKKGMYILNKSGNISPMKNGHKIRGNCWVCVKNIDFN